MKFRSRTTPVLEVSIIDIGLLRGKGASLDLIQEPFWNGSTMFMRQIWRCPGHTYKSDAGDTQLGSGPSKFAVTDLSRNQVELTRMSSVPGAVRFLDGVS
jgi:hypothetical protein